MQNLNYDQPRKRSRQPSTGWRGSRPKEQRKCTEKPESSNKSIRLSIVCVVCRWNMPSRAKFEMFNGQKWTLSSGWWMLSLAAGANAKQIDAINLSIDMSHPFKHSFDIIHWPSWGWFRHSATRSIPFGWDKRSMRHIIIYESTLFLAVLSVVFLRMTDT